MSTNTNIQFRDWLERRLADPEFRAEWEASEPAYQVTRLRIKRGLTQKQLAKLVGTKQSSIARLESGRTEPRLSFLRRVVKALRGRLEVRIAPLEDAPILRQPSVIVFFQSGNAPLPCVDNWPRSEYSYAHDTLNTPILENPTP